MKHAALLTRLAAVFAAAALPLGTALAQGVLAPSKPPAAPVNKLAQAAASVGVKRCLPAITRLSTLMVEGSRNHDLLLDWDKARPDAGPLFGLVGIEYPNAGVAASITAVPDPTGTCSVAAERISVAPFTCASIAQQELGAYRMTRLLPNYTVYIDDKEPNSSVSLIDSPPGCLVIRRFVDYHWQDPAAGAAKAPARR